MPSRPDSLHAMRPGGEKNQYQQAIAAVGEILLNYDYDKKVPVYGFGGKPKLPHFFSNIALHCFPCNGNPQDPEVFGLEGIENVYAQLLPNVELAGPTLFAPLIQETMKLAQACKENGSKVYNILLILTGNFLIFFNINLIFIGFFFKIDGEINDMDKSAAAIVDAAYLPLSIIIIGIGNADFGKMEYLDGDNGLVDSDGRKAKRDLVQFVPFNKFKGNPAKLAESVLEELPMQLCEYMRMVGIKPDPPQVVDINNMKFSTQQSIASIQNIPNPQNMGIYGAPNQMPMNQGYDMQGKPNPRFSSPMNQMPIGLNNNIENPMNPQSYGGAPHFGSFAAMPGQNPQNIKGPSPGIYGQPPQGYGQMPPQGPYNVNNNNNNAGVEQRFGQNTMAFGQNFMTGFLQQGNGGNAGVPNNNNNNNQYPNNNNQNPNNINQNPNNMNNVLSPSGRYNYGN